MKLLNYIIEGGKLIPIVKSRAKMCVSLNVNDMKFDHGNFHSTLVLSQANYKNGDTSY